MVQHNTLFLPSHGKTLLHVKLFLSFVINSLIKGKKKQTNKQKIVLTQQICEKNEEKQMTVQNVLRPLKKHTMQKYRQLSALTYHIDKD